MVASWKLFGRGYLRLWLPDGGDRKPVLQQWTCTLGARGRGFEHAPSRQLEG